MRFKRFLSVFLTACTLGLMTSVFTVTPVAAAGITVTPSVAPGGYVYVQGSGFTASTSVNIYSSTADPIH